MVVVVVAVVVLVVVVVVVVVAWLEVVVDVYDDEGLFDDSTSSYSLLPPLSSLLEYSLMQGSSL